MKTEDKELNEAAEKCVKEIMKIEYKKYRRTQRELDYFAMDCVAKTRRQMGYD